jgi:hypothetical protein
MDSTSSNEPATTGKAMGVDTASRLGIAPGERLYPRADTDTLAEWTAEVHEFLDNAEEAAERTRGDSRAV